MTTIPLLLTSELVNLMQANMTMEPSQVIPFLEKTFATELCSESCHFQFKWSRKIGDTFMKEVYVLPYKNQNLVLSFMHFIPSNHWTVSSLKVVDRLTESLAA